jgi:uncharacterized protein YjbI with pentapeptide repeats
MLNDALPLRTSGPDDDVRAIARTLTIVTMRRLDWKRFETLLRFLVEAGLVDEDNLVIELKGADLIEIDLSHSWIDNIDRIRKADLRGANLRGANLPKANLERANLERAKLVEADLRGAEYDDHTKWPKGFDPEEAGANKVERI